MTSEQINGLIGGIKDRCLDAGGMTTVTVNRVEENGLT